jgi:hypothetical protein
MNNRPPADDEQTTKALPVTDENFDALWEDLKARMREARGERDFIRTFGEGPTYQKYGATLSFGEPDQDEDGKLACTVGVSMRHSSQRFATHREDLINIAAHALGTVADMDELNKEQR